MTAMLAMVGFRRRSVSKQDAMFGGNLAAAAA